MLLFFARMPMRVFENLEIHIAHGCNLTCESCSHYSNQGHTGLLSVEEGEEWMVRWSHRLRPHVFSLLGGEPTIHPRLCDWVLAVRKHWPQAHLRLLTNGFLLHRHPELPIVLKKTNGNLYVSIHHDSPEYREKFSPIRELIESWRQKHGIPVTYHESYKNWTRRYHGHGAAMEPYEDNRPRDSWEICPAKYCKQLYQEALWKCPPLTYLRLQDAKYHLSEKWRPYLAYEPLRPDCSDVELDAFLAKQDEPHCSMCAAHPRRMELPLHGRVPLGQVARPG
jgi:hypothetical protein